jgi:hypothetical protein
MSSFSIWTFVTLVMGIPGAAWGSIQIYNYFFGPKPLAPNALNAVVTPEQSVDEERVLVKFDMARALLPGTFEYKISTILRNLPSDDQLPLLIAPEYVSEWARKRYDLWVGIAGLILSLAITPLFLLAVSIWTDGISTKGSIVVGAIVVAFLSVPFAMLRRAVKAKRLSRRAERFAKFREDNGLRLAFEWTPIKSRY